MTPRILVLSLTLAALTPLPGAAHEVDARLRALSYLIKRQPENASLYVRRGEVYRRLGKLRRAMHDYDRAARLQPALADVHFARSLAWMDLRRWNKALDSIQRFVKTRPAHGPALLTRARILTRLGRRRNAAATYDLALPLLAVHRPEHFLEQARAHAALGPEGVLRAVDCVCQGAREFGPIVSLTSYARKLGAIDLLPSASPRTEPGRLMPSLPPPVLAEAVVVSIGATWRYLDDGSNPGTAWRAPGFNDATWRQGPAQLGYGEGDEQTVVRYGPKAAETPKYITTYFRHSFQIADPTLFKKARVLLLRDDGAVVYLNGKEIVRNNMPAAAIGWQTTASTPVEFLGEFEIQRLFIDHKLLKKGTNVLAVEVHQHSNTSDDLSFALELRASDGVPVVTRGPFLQRGAPTGAVIRWRTDYPTETVAFLGTSPGKLNRSIANNKPTIEHTAVISGLNADTLYYYGIGNNQGILAGNDPDHRFHTPPRVGTNKPTRIWVIGDSGTGSRHAAAVRDAWLKYSAKQPADVWLMLGDNAYPFGTDLDYEFTFFRMYPSILRNTFVWPTLGNHDAFAATSANTSGAYYDIFDLPRKGESGGLASGTEAYYSFDHGNIHFVCLNSEDVDRSGTGAMHTWLKADLAATKARWIIAYWHHPPYSKGSHDSDVELPLVEMRKFALPILEAAGVDLVLTGHSHAYERSHLIDGHYGFSPSFKPTMSRDRGDGSETGDGVYAKPTLAKGKHEGAVYIVAGSSGGVSLKPRGHPAMIVSLASLGSLVLDVESDRLDVRFLDQTAAVRDSFTLRKGLRRTLTRAEPSIPTGQGGEQNLRLDAGRVHAGKLYILAGSLSPTPGFNLGKIHVPLTRDPWFDFTMLVQNSPFFQNSRGKLDANGRATARIKFPPIENPPPALFGVVLHHAYIVYDANTRFMASNTVRLTLLR